MSRKGRMRAVAVLGAVLTIFALMPVLTASAVAGAGFSGTNIPADGDHCFNGPGIVNCNIYDGKQYVWINGGPANGTSQLTDGYWFFVVGVPGGENSDINDAATVPDDGTGTAKNLSDDYDAYTNRVFHVSSHKIDSYSGTHDKYPSATQGLKIRLMPYSDTTNPGGEYFVGLCFLGTDADSSTWTYPADPSQCKYDNFKVKAGETVVDFGSINGLKYYDANRNGQWDSGEAGIKDWPINFSDGTSNTVFTKNDGTFSVKLSSPDTYSFSEESPNSPWVQTGNTADQTQITGAGGSSVSLANFVYTVNLETDDVVGGLNFGNVCQVTNRGGLTLGFWSNNNGKAILQQNEAAMTTLINTTLWLVNANGTRFTVSGTFNQKYTALRNWLLAATSVNASYMLSAQLLTTAFDRAFANLANYLVRSPVTWGPLTAGNWYTIDFLVGAIGNATNGFIKQYPNTTASGTPRNNATGFQTMFNAINNNTAIVTPPTQGECPAPTFATS
jgi:hypothetical protein